MSDKIQTKEFKEEDKKVVQRSLLKLKEESLYFSWILKKKYKKKIFKRAENRIILISKFRIITIGKRRGSIKQKICRNGHFFQIRLIERKSDSNFFIQFENFCIDVHSYDSDKILRIILSRYFRIIHSFSHDKICLFKGDLNQFDNNKTIPIGICENFFRCYKGWCNYFGVIPFNEILEKKSFFADETRKKSKIPSLDLTFLKHYKKKSLTLDVLSSITKSIEFNNYFKEIIINRTTQKKIIQVISDTITKSITLKKLTITNLKSKIGFKQLGNALKNMQLPLTYLDLSGNRIPEKDVDIFSHGIYKMNYGLKYLNLARNKLSSVSIVKILSSLKNNESHLKIEYLNLSENKFSKRGTIFFKKFYKLIYKKKKLSHLELEFCHLDLNLFSSVLQKYKLSSLRILNLSRNKIKTVEDFQISEILQTLSSLKKFSFNSCNLKNNHYSTIFQNIFQNKELKQFSINLSRNYIGSKGKIL
ncbi:leucine-rich repeat isoform f-related [Anaeramoeba flamelloides]|uniref:Leucine-rich repeat isoform f-related n=1 Tax=Anaeramoeba flamelloides TaxID=1746091 RepID=A0AAV7Z9Z0_9EUKA|nr:leucine-rich repeat isoform f-related [Anaeramoeba flamelloides]